MFLHNFTPLSFFVVSACSEDALMFLNSITLCKAVEFACFLANKLVSYYFCL